MTSRFLDAAGDLLREVFEQFERENPEQAAELSRRVAGGTPSENPQAFVRLFARHERVPMPGGRYSKMALLRPLIYRMAM